MQKRLQILLAFLIASIGLASCAKITLHPITGQDIQLVKSGETIVAPKAGAFLSSEYISDVMKARIDK